MKSAAVLLRVVHGAFAVYFILCLGYLYVAAIMGRFDLWLGLALVSLGLEGLAVFVLNNGDCPLIHIQRRLGDDKPFFEIFLSPRVAKQAIPFFAVLTWVGLGLVILSFAIHLIKGF